MNTDFTLKNFRIFDEEGLNIPLRPITILTGCNNSGKSSIVKALCLLKDFSSQIESDYEDGKGLRLGYYRMDFHKKPHHIMGTFDSVCHHATIGDDNLLDHEDSHNGEFITFEVIVESSMLLQEVVLHLEFASLKEDELNNAFLHAYSIRTLDGNVIYEATRKGHASMDFSCVKKSLLYFLYGQRAISEWQNKVLYLQASMSELAEDDSTLKNFSEIVLNICNQLGDTALIYLLEWQVSHSRHVWQDGSSSVAGSLLRICADSSSIVNIPSLGVYCFFPCFQVFHDMDKIDVRKEINKYISLNEEKLSSLDQKKIDLFLDFFEKSDADTLSEFVNQQENQQLFIDSNVCRFSDEFGWPNNSWHINYNDCIYNEDDLPQEANWTITIEAMNLINKIVTKTSKSYLYFDEINNTDRYHIESDVDTYIKKTIEDIFGHLMSGSLSYSPTTVVRPQRMYSLEENSDFAETLKLFFEKKRMWMDNEDSIGARIGNIRRKNENRYEPCTFLNTCFFQLGIAHHVEIKSHAGGYGVTIHLYKDENDKEGMLLADKGFGVLQLFATLLKIENTILEIKLNEELYTYDSTTTTGLSKEIVGYLRTYNQLYPATIALEEPECHLHPSLQSKLANIITDAYKTYGIHFLIESHSEYFIRKLQLNVSQRKIKSDDISILYVNSSSRPSYLPAVSDIGIEPDGTLKNEFGSGFFDESIRLSKELYRTKDIDDEE